MTEIHTEAYEFAGKTIRITPHTAPGWEFEAEVTDWADRVFGGSWQAAQPDEVSAQEYGLRGLYCVAGIAPGTPWDVDDEVLHAKIMNSWHDGEEVSLGERAGEVALFHISEVKA